LLWVALRSAGYLRRSRPGRGGYHIFGRAVEQQNRAEQDAYYNDDGNGEI